MSVTAQYREGFGSAHARHNKRCRAIAIHSHGRRRVLHWWRHTRRLVPLEKKTTPWKVSYIAGEEPTAKHFRDDDDDQPPPGVMTEDTPAGYRWAKPGAYAWPLRFVVI